MHDTRTKRYRHLNFFQHECELEARVPRVRLPDGRVALVEPPWAGRCSGFTLLFEALNGLFQSAKRKARGYGRFETIRTVFFLIAGKLDFSKLNPYVA